jgi:tRNA(Ile2) C34 agmatinyltransferase TiaS
MSNDKTPTDAQDTTGAGIDAVVEGEEAEGLVTDDKKTAAGEKTASGLAEAAAGVVTPSPGAGRYDGGEEP